MVAGYSTVRFERMARHLAPTGHRRAPRGLPRAEGSSVVDVDVDDPPRRLSICALFARWSVSGDDGGCGVRSRDGPDGCGPRRRPAWRSPRHRFCVLAMREALMV